MEGGVKFKASKLRKKAKSVRSLYNLDDMLLVKMERGGGLSRLHMNAKGRLVEGVRDTDRLGLDAIHHRCAQAKMVFRDFVPGRWNFGRSFAGHFAPQDFHDFGRRLTNGRWEHHGKVAESKCWGTSRAWG